MPSRRPQPNKKTDNKILIIRKCDEYLDQKYASYVMQQHTADIFLILPGGEGIFYDPTPIVAIIMITKAIIIFSFNSNQVD